MTESQNDPGRPKPDGPRQGDDESGGKERFRKMEDCPKPRFIDIDTWAAGIEERIKDLEDAAQQRFIDDGGGAKK